MVTKLASEPFKFHETLTQVEDRLVREVLERVTGRWSLSVLRILAEVNGPARFSDFSSYHPAASSRPSTIVIAPAIGITIGITIVIAKRGTTMSVTATNTIAMIAAVIDDGCLP